MQHFAPNVVPNGHDPTRSDTNRVESTMNVNFPPPEYEPPSISSIAPPRSKRPSLPVRAVKATGKQSPGLLVGAAIVEFLHYVLPLLRELF
jgi:hypothetical protein